MAHFEEQTGQPYDWGEGGVYVIEREDPVDGGLDGVSNRQGRELTRRTRNLHGRLSVAEGEIDTLQEALPIAAEAAKNVAVGLAKGYTDQAAAAVRNEMAVGDQTALNTAKAYADRIVAALVDNSPELLNTLEELAAALGGDPEFATTVMRAIGERATTTDVNTALAGKANTSHGHASVAGLDWYNEDRGGIVPDHYLVAKRSTPLSGGTRLYLKTLDKWYDLVEVSYADSCPWAGVVGKPMASKINDGLMAKGDKAKLDGLNASDFVDKSSSYVLGFSNIPFFAKSTILDSTVENREIASVLNMAAAGDNVTQLRISDYMGILSAWVRGNKSNVWHELYGTHNLKIIRGAVNANSNGIWCSGGEIDKIEPNYVKVTHNIGHTRYSATATAHAETILVRGDNVVTVFTKAASYTTFIVTDGQGNSNEPTAFDFIIIAE